MKPGSLLVFLAILSLCGLVIQIGATPLLDPIKNNSPAIYYLLCWVASV